jgi:hypothetical protein
MRLFLSGPGRCHGAGPELYDVAREPDALERPHRGRGGQADVALRHRHAHLAGVKVKAYH